MHDRGLGRVQAQLDRELRQHNQGSLLLYLLALFYTDFIFISSYIVTVSSDLFWKFSQKTNVN